MSIPKLTKDLAVIQKLSDLPNSTEGLTAQQLKAKFDESGLTIQQWINAVLIPALTAANIPFAGTSELNAENVQAAVEAVHAQIRDAASGAIVNGSVTAEKLSADLLARVFGGRPWVSLDEPTAQDNAAAGFPVGQIWLQPAFTVTNAAGDSWTAAGGTVTAQENRLTVTGNQTVTTVSISQSRSGIGQDGDRVWVLFGVENRNSEITGLTVSLNGGEAQDVSAGAFAGTLTGGSLTVKISAAFPTTSLANGSFDVVNYAVVNIDQILRQTTDAHEMTDWVGYLQSLLPLTAHISPAAVYIQTLNGSWWLMTPEVYPVERGGTGLAAVSYGDLFYGTADNRLERLPKPGEDGCFLQYTGGRLQWVTADAIAQNQSFLRTQYGSYNGSGAARTITLPVSPKRLRFENGDYSSFTDKAYLEQGQTVFQTVTGGKSYVKLSGNALTFWTDGDKLTLGNSSGDTYYWTAIY